MNKRMNPSWQPSGKSDYLPLLGDECKWYRVIIDEAQCIKNKNTKAAVGAALLQAQTRFCMSGTPMVSWFLFDSFCGFPSRDDLEQEIVILIWENYR